MFSQHENILTMSKRLFNVKRSKGQNVLKRMVLNQLYNKKYKQYCRFIHVRTLTDIIHRRGQCLFNFYFEVASNYFKRLQNSLQCGCNSFYSDDQVVKCQLCKHIITQQSKTVHHVNTSFYCLGRLIMLLAKMRWQVLWWFTFPFHVFSSHKVFQRLVLSSRLIHRKC